jgi:hypothetical protein
MPRFRSNETLTLLAVLLALSAAYVFAYKVSEPFYYNDETRHLMSGVYFRDLFQDMPVRHLRDYTVNYYLQYPALGLLIWPPFFYLLEGLLMSVFGTSIIVPKMLVGLFGMLACAYLFYLVRRSHDVSRATVAVLILGLSPLVFTLSHYVMLEVPTMALGLAATYHFVKYLDVEKRRDLLLAGLFSTLAALTRFDAVYLVPLFVILLIVRRRQSIIWRKEVLAVAGLALLLVLPFYALTASYVGWLHLKQVSDTLRPDFPRFFSLQRLLYYPAYLREQVTIFALLPMAVGLVSSLTARRKQSWTYLVVVFVTYLTFTPIGEMDTRHTIYWIPALSLFAADGIAFVAHRLGAPRLYLPLAALVVTGMALSVLATPLGFVRGYGEAARYVVANSDTSPYCLFVGTLNGDFIYQVSRHDPARRIWVLRADKLFYNLLIDAKFQYKQIARSDEEILGTIFRYDPDFIVAEEPSGVDFATLEDQVRNDNEDRLRSVVSRHPERFRLEQMIALDSKSPPFQGMKLRVYRNTFRNEHPERSLNIEILGLRRSVQSVVPENK